MRELLDGVLVLAILRLTRLDQRVDLIDGEQHRIVEGNDPGDVLHDLLIAEPGRPDAPDSELLAAVGVEVQKRFAEILDPEVVALGEDQCAQDVLGPPPMPRVLRVDGLDVVVEDLRGERRLAEDRGELLGGECRVLPEAIEELGELRAVGGRRAAQVLEQADEDRSPEVLSVKKFHQNEVTAGRMHALAHLAEQVGLARACGAADGNPERARRGTALCVCERAEDVIDRRLVQARDMHQRFGVPHVVGSGGPIQTDRFESGAVLVCHHWSSIAKRWHGWDPTRTASARSSDVSSI